MKKVIMLAAMAVLSIQAQAQIVSSRSSMTTRQVIEEPKTNKGWSTFGFEYNPSSFDPKHGDSESFTSLALTYTNAIPLTQSFPLYLEWGIGGQYSFYSEDDFKIKYVSLKVPVNLIYDFEIPNTSISIDPFLGLKLRGNIWGQAKEDGDDSIDLFDSDEGDWKRFQIGWNIGVKAKFNNKFFVGLSYGSDFSEMAEDMKINETSISLGIVF